eukprot:3487680-Amphidinium_carterae.1
MHPKKLNRQRRHFPSTPYKLRQGRSCKIASSLEEKENNLFPVFMDLTETKPSPALARGQHSDLTAF